MEWGQLIQHDWYPSEKREVWIPRQKPTRGMTHENGGRDWRGTAANKGAPKVDSHPQKLKETRKDCI